MDWLDRWDLLLLFIGAFVGVMALVRLMAARRDHLVEDVRQQMNEERKRRSGGK